MQPSRGQIRIGTLISEKWMRNLLISKMAKSSFIHTSKNIQRRRWKWLDRHVLWPRTRWHAGPSFFGQCHQPYFWIGQQPCNRIHGIDGGSAHLITTLATRRWWIVLYPICSTEPGPVPCALQNHRRVHHFPMWKRWPMPKQMAVIKSKDRKYLFPVATTTRHPTLSIWYSPE